MQNHAAKFIFLRFHYKINPMKNYIKAIIAFLFVFLMFLQASAQKKPYHGITFSKHNFVDTLKIKIWDGAIIIPVEINGETKNLMFDTGAEMGFWIGEDENWMTPSGDSLTLVDSQNTRHKKAVIKLPPVKMGDITIENYPLFVDNALEDYVCDKIDGAFGYDLVVRGFSFKFDTKDSLMIVTDRKRFFSKEERRQPKLKYKRYHNARPMVVVKFPFASLKMVFDTGAVGGGIELTEYDVRLLSDAYPNMAKIIDDITVQKDTTIITSAGFFGSLKDAVPYRILHCQDVELDRLMLKDVWISTDTRLNKVGSKILEHNSLIVNGYKRRLVLIPHDGNLVQIVANENKRGLKLDFTDKNDTLGILKAVVRKNGDAYQKGVRTGDYLISVNGVEINDYCTYFNLANKVRANQDLPLHYVFRSPSGEIKELEL